MYVTFSEGPLPSTLCPEAVQWVLEVLKVPMNLTNWVLVGSSSPNLAVQLHIRLKSEISVVFGFLKAAVDELPKETIELTTGTLREANSLAPIYWEFVLPQLDKGAPVDMTGMAYVPDDPDEQDCMDSMTDVDAKPKGTLRCNWAIVTPHFIHSSCCTSTGTSTFQFLLIFWYSAWYVNTSSIKSWAATEATAACCHNSCSTYALK